jgi:hypothetical protein
MNAIKKAAGFIWLILGPASIIALLYRAIHEFSTLPAEKLQEARVFWIVIILIFIPIALGFTIFGWYAIKGEYDRVGA